jgi:hypothetical protein
MREPRALVEYFFRHVFGRLGAVLSRSLGGTALRLAGRKKWVYNVYTQPTR